MSHSFKKLLLPQEIIDHIQNDDFYKTKYTEKISDNYYIEVDKKLVKLVKELWKRKIFTHFSCQGDLKKDKDYLDKPPSWWNVKEHGLIKWYNFAYISFFNLEYLERFLAITNPTKYWKIEKDRYTVRFPPSTIGKIFKDIKAHAK